MTLADKLRETVVSLEKARSADNQSNTEKRYQDMLKAAHEAMAEAASKRKRKATVSEVLDINDHEIDLNHIANLNEDDYGSERYKHEQQGQQEQLRHVGIDRLRGNAARLRAELEKEGLELSLEHFVFGAGGSRKGQCNAWHLIAKW